MTLLPGWVLGSAQCIIDVPFVDDKVRLPWNRQEMRVRERRPVLVQHVKEETLLFLLTYAAAACVGATGEGFLQEEDSLFG